MIIQVKLFHVPSNREFISDTVEMDTQNLSTLFELLKNDASYIEFTVGGQRTIFKPNVLKDCISTIIELKETKPSVGFSQRFGGN